MSSNSEYVYILEHFDQTRTGNFFGVDWVNGVGSTSSPAVRDQAVAAGCTVSQTIEVTRRPAF